MIVKEESWPRINIRNTFVITKESQYAHHDTINNRTKLWCFSSTFVLKFRAQESETENKESNCLTSSCNFASDQSHRVSSSGLHRMRISARLRDNESSIWSRSPSLDFSPTDTDMNVNLLLHKRCEHLLFSLEALHIFGVSIPLVNDTVATVIG